MNDNNIKFSVIIPLYNKEKSIKRTIECVLSQSIGDFELIIVNDGSTDNSIEAAQSINDKRILIIDKRNGGVSSARNVGIKNANHNYIAFLDADDLWEPDFLMTIRRLIIKYPQAMAYATRFLQKLNNKNIYLSPSNHASIKEGPILDYYKEANKAPLIHSSAICIKKEVFDIIMPFDERISHGEDRELWIRLVDKFIVVYSSSPQAYFILDSENRSIDNIPPPERTLSYYLDLNNITNKYQLQYHQKHLYNRVYFYLKKRKFNWAFLLIKKHWKSMSLATYLYFYLLNSFRRICRLQALIVRLKL